MFLLAIVEAAAVSLLIKYEFSFYGEVRRGIQDSYIRMFVKTAGFFFIVFLDIVWVADIGAEAVEAVEADLVPS